MSTKDRAEEILNILKENNKPISASKISSTLKVSRQIIVGDIAILRAKGIDILSTHKGYILNSNIEDTYYTFKITCIHNNKQTQKEIYTIIDNGGKLIDVIVEHPLYGLLSGNLNLSSRFEADSFLKKSSNEKAMLLSDLTNGIHFHNISCKDETTAIRIKNSLSEIGFLVN